MKHFAGSGICGVAVERHFAEADIEAAARKLESAAAETAMEKEAD